MNIPFFRQVEYLDDGHYLYQCLQCGEKIDVGDGWFSPRFCWSCGVEYKGFILRKKEDWVYGAKPKKDKLLFVVQEATIWEGSESEEPEWRFCSGYAVDRQQVIKDLKWHKEGTVENEKSVGLKIKTIYRIVPQRGKAYPECFAIDPDKYFKRTGKKFNRSDHERVA